MTHYRYEAFGSPKEIRDSHGNKITFEHDVLGRRTKSVDPDRGTEDTVYTAFGEPKTVTDAAGTQTFWHDGIGRLFKRRDAAGNQDVRRYDGWGPAERGQLVEDWTETAQGAVTARTTYGYVGSGHGRGALDTTVRTIGDKSFRVRSIYRSHGRVDSVEYPDQGGAFGVQHAYDDFGHLVSVKDKQSGVPYWTLKEGDKGYRIGLEEFGNLAQTRWSYKPGSGRVDRIVTTTLKDSVRSQVQDLSYVFTPRGNVDRRTDHRTPTNSRSYVYDSLDRLTFVHNASSGAELERFEYDAIGNVTFKSGVGTLRYDGPRPHAVTAAGENSYGYDSRGNQDLRVVAGDTQRIEFNSFGMPQAVRSGAGDLAAEFGYDANDSRVRLHMPGKADTYYVGDLYEESHTSNAVEYRYRVWAGREIAQVTQKREHGILGTRSVKYLHSDGIGSTDLVTSHDVEPQRIEYGAFGNVTDSALKQAEVTSGFTGHRHDEALGLIDMRGRLFDPKLGRFISPDPLLSRPFFSQSLNRYSYVWNNPLRYVDPTGLQGLEIDVIFDPDVGSATGEDKKTYAKWAKDKLSSEGKSGGGENRSSTEAPKDEQPLPAEHIDWTPVDHADPAYKVRLEDSHRNPVKSDTWLGLLGAVAYEGFCSIMCGTANAPMETDESTIIRESEAWKAAGAASLGRTRAVRSVANAARTAKQVHHIATNKSVKNGYTAAFEKIFKKAGMTLDDAANKVELPGHAGRHASEYHDYVLDRLRTVTEGLSGADAATALRAELGAIRQQLLANPDMVRGIGIP